MFQVPAYKGPLSCEEVSHLSEFVTWCSAQNTADPAMDRKYATTALIWVVLSVPR
jgi:hypothetical protein